MKLTEALSKTIIENIHLYFVQETEGYDPHVEMAKVLGVSRLEAKELVFKCIFTHRSFATLRWIKAPTKNSLRMAKTLAIYKREQGEDVTQEDVFEHYDTITSEELGI